MLSICLEILWERIDKSLVLFSCDEIFLSHDLKILFGWNIYRKLFLNKKIMLIKRLESLQTSPLRFLKFRMVVHFRRIQRPYCQSDWSELHTQFIPIFIMHWAIFLLTIINYGIINYNFMTQFNNYWFEIMNQFNNYWQSTNNKIITHSLVNYY